MKEYVIEEDCGRIGLYTALNLLLTVSLMLLSIAFYAVNQYLLAFFGVTGLWFSVKAMCRFGKKLLARRPVCELGRDQITIYSLPGKPKEMKYSQVKEAKMMRGYSSLKLFFRGDQVTHPSGWYYVGIVYPFKRAALDGVEENVVKCLKKHGIEIKKIEKEKK